MPPLAELQRHFAQAVLHGTPLSGAFAGRISVDEAMSVHRDTVTGALVNALRLSYPTVDALVGTQFFDQAARMFMEAHLPKTASLATYGQEFAEFLTRFAPVGDLPYLADVARLDHAVEDALRASSAVRRFALDAHVSIALPQSLCVLRLMHPADEIRAGIGDDDALAGIVMTPAERCVLIWRRDCDAAVCRVDAAAGCFLASLLAREGVQAAFGAAMAIAPEAETLQAIQAQIFAAPFCTVISNSQEPSP